MKGYVKVSAMESYYEKHMVILEYIAKFCDYILYALDSIDNVVYLLLITTICRSIGDIMAITLEYYIS